MSDPFASDLPSIPRVPRKAAASGKAAVVVPPARAKPSSKAAAKTKPKIKSSAKPIAKAIKAKAKIPARRAVVSLSKRTRRRPIYEEEDEDDNGIDDDEANGVSENEEDKDEVNSSASGAGDSGGSGSCDVDESGPEADGGDKDLDGNDERRSGGSVSRAKSQRMGKAVAFQETDKDDDGSGNDRDDVDDRGNVDDDADDGVDDDDDDDIGNSNGADESADLDEELDVDKPGIENAFDEYSEDENDLLESDEEGDSPSNMDADSSARLTKRQRALQGEDVDSSLSKLASPIKRNKKVPLVDDDLTTDEAREMRKQQKVRLRNMIHEKRNKEKRAAMVDKVLRGVTSKRKKLSLASEAYNAEVGSRLTKNEARVGCYRYTSKVGGALLSIPEGEQLPAGLGNGRQVASYPPKCDRDPKTGKRILAPAVTANPS
jgi:PAPA-1-like conserved region